MRKLSRWIWLSWWKRVAIAATIHRESRIHHATGTRVDYRGDWDDFPDRPEMERRFPLAEIAYDRAFRGWERLPGINPHDRLGNWAHDVGIQ